MYVPPPWALLLMPFSVLGPKASVIMGGLHVAVIFAAFYVVFRYLGRRSSGPSMYVLFGLATYFASTLVCNLHLLIWARIFG
ncbi:hypothetical protein [Rhodopirellula sp. SWK7]|uniref:hypothetical protein n=1 Tax=Rhodopirellula sp. SWK7 TaxID=595460 RepID=UPI0002BE4506|nr:hypothetical protein [Rhodopirellula sp. SWK7]EMI41734.1 membrane protein [Rhodopirellula sp. SWK7]